MRKDRETSFICKNASQESDCDFDYLLLDLYDTHYRRNRARRFSIAF